MSPPPAIDLDGLGVDRGGHLLLKRALAPLAPGERLEVRGRAPELAVHLRAWCREQGHRFEPAPSPLVGRVVRGSSVDARRRNAARAGERASGGPTPVPGRAPATWGLAARGALVEAGGPEFRFALDTRDAVWTDAAAGIYRQAAAGQWDPATAVDWDASVDLAPDVEEAVVQVMTYLVENENAALVVPARFLGQVHPHFREVMGVLAVQVADEARHVAVFTRRAELRGGPLGLSTAGGQASLLTLVEEPVTRQVTRLALADEARHVAFGMAHLEHVLGADPGLRGRLATAVRHRHDALVHTAGLNEEVFDSLVVLAAGSWRPDAVAAGFARVQGLEAEMADGRKRRLVRLGFSPDDAAELSALHTRSFM
jgi:hypothetical protein